MSNVIPTQSELLEGVKDLLEITDKVVENAEKNKDPIQSSTLRIQRALKGVVLSSMVDGAFPEQPGASEGIGKVVSMAKPKAQREAEVKEKQAKTKQPDPSTVKVGEVTSSRIEKGTGVKTSKAKEEADNEFMGVVKQMSAKEFKDKYNKPGLLKAIGKQINEHEDEKIIKISGKGSGKEAMQKAIINYFELE